MGTYTVEGTTDTPGRELIEHRMRALLSTIACEMFDIEVPDHIDEGTVIPQTPASRAAKRWRDDMYAALGIAPGPAAPVAAPDAPAADPTGQPRVITSIRRPAAEADPHRVGTCRDEDPELFFPVGTTGPALLQIEQAKAICRRCPVINECLSWALENQEFGVAGGMSEDERRAHKRRPSTARAAA